MVNTQRLQKEAVTEGKLFIRVIYDNGGGGGKLEPWRDGVWREPLDFESISFWQMQSLGVNFYISEK